MGARRGGRENSPLAGLLRRSAPTREEPPANATVEESEEHTREERTREDVRTKRETAGAGERLRREAPEERSVGLGRANGRRGGAAGAAGPTAPETPRKKRGRPRGGRRSNPDYVQISARIHRDVRFSLEKVLVERSEREGRYVEMAEVIEDLMRFYLDHGDPYDLLDGR